MRLDGGNARPVSSDDSQGIDPTWSPEGDQIAFASNREGPTQIYIMNPDGSRLRQVTRGVRDMVGRISWSPDGEWLDFYDGPNGDRNIYIIDVDGETTQLTTAATILGRAFRLMGGIVFTSFETATMKSTSCV
jgi:TolB protein